MDHLYLVVCTYHYPNKIMKISTFKRTYNLKNKCVKISIDKVYKIHYFLVLLILINSGINKILGLIM